MKCQFLFNPKSVQFAGNLDYEEIERFWKNLNSLVFRTRFSTPHKRHLLLTQELEECSRKSEKNVARWLYNKYLTSSKLLEEANKELILLKTGLND